MDDMNLQNMLELCTFNILHHFHLCLSAASSSPSTSSSSPSSSSSSSSSSQPVARWCTTDGDGQRSQCTGEMHLHLGRGPSLQHQPTGRPVIPSVQEYCTCRCTCYMYVHVYAHMYIYVHVLYVHMCVMCRGYYYTYTLYMYMYTILV